MSNETTIDLPPGFAFLKFAGERYVLVNDNSGGHRSQWTDRRAMVESAWGWWYDVRSNHRGLHTDAWEEEINAQFY